MKWREGRKAVIVVHVAGRARGRCGNVSPADFSEGTERYDVAEALPILQFFRDRLRVKHKTVVILKYIQTSNIHSSGGFALSAESDVHDPQIAFVTYLI